MQKRFYVIDDEMIDRVRQTIGYYDPGYDSVADALSEMTGQTYEYREIDLDSPNVEVM
jgi:hypothetical protein